MSVKRRLYARKKNRLAYCICKTGTLFVTLNLFVMSVFLACAGPAYLTL